jgi:hypothetical protein
MVRKWLAALLAAVVCVAFTQAADKADKGDKEEPKGIKAKILKVNIDGMTAQVQTEDGKKVELKIEEKTKFIGPRGGVSDKGIKDDRFVVGNEIRIVMDGKTVKEIHLPMREEAKDKGIQKDAVQKDKPVSKDAVQKDAVQKDKPPSKDAVQKDSTQKDSPQQQKDTPQQQKDKPPSKDTPQQQKDKDSPQQQKDSPQQQKDKPKDK